MNTLASIELVDREILGNRSFRNEKQINLHANSNFGIYKN